MPKIFVELLPEFLQGHSLANSSAVVIDVLRASTTMVQALANGADAVIPCLGIDDARSAAERLSPQPLLLGGERRGVPIEGFDLGNSPFEYTAETVSNKTVVFTTTNGTRALLMAREAARVYVGAFINRRAIVKRLCEDDCDVHLVCAGTDGQLTPEDILFAGAVTSDLLALPGSRWQTGNLSARMGADYFLARSRSPEDFQAAFLDGPGAQNLLELGMERDIEFAMKNDVVQIVPRWNASAGRITIDPTR